MAHDPETDFHSSSPKNQNQTHELYSQKKVRNRYAMVLVGGLTMLGPFASDASLPSFPAMGIELNANQDAVQQTLTLYWAALAFMSLWHGAISDALGRRRIILISLIWFVVATVACALAANLETLLIFRFLQGLAAGAGLVVGRAIIRDMYEGAEAQKRIALISMMFALAPLVAPAIGGQLQLLWGWRSTFLVLSILGLILLILSVVALSETLSEKNRIAFHPSSLFSSYREVFTYSKFLQIAGAITVSQSALFISVAGAPAIVIGHYHLSEAELHVVFIPMVSGLLLGSYVSSRFAGRLAVKHQVMIGFALMLCSALTELAIVASETPYHPMVFAPLLVYAFGLLVVATALTGQLLDAIPHLAGTVSSCQYFMQACGLAAVSGIVIPFASFSLVGLAVTKLGLLIMGLCLWVLSNKTKSDTVAV